MRRSKVQDQEKKVSKFQYTCVVSTPRGEMTIFTNISFKSNSSHSNFCFVKRIIRYKPQSPMGRAGHWLVALNLKHMNPSGYFECEREVVTDDTYL